MKNVIANNSDIDDDFPIYLLVTKTDRSIRGFLSHGM